MKVVLLILVYFFTYNYFSLQSMKQMKVRLVQQMKAENEKFREWKVQKDKELHKLRNQNVKNQNQLKKMERVHSLQQNVLRRKLEAAAATNKRIMVRQVKLHSRHSKIIM